MKRKVPTKSVSPAKTSRFSSMVGKYRLSWDSVPGPHLPKPPHSEAVVIGDTVLLEDEVNLAVFVALESGLSVTALHNHFFFDHPRLLFMHIEGEGTVEHLASSVRLLYDKVGEFRTAHPTPADSFLKPALPDISTITADPLNKIFRSSGEVNKGMIKFTFGRA